MVMSLLASLLLAQAPGLGLEDLLAQVDTANPSVRAAQLRVVAARGGVTRARVPEEPVVSVQVEEVPTDPRTWMEPSSALAAPLVSAQAGVMVPITGMPFLKAQMAEAMVAMARADEKMARIGLRRAARVAFWDLWLNGEAQRINREAGHTLEAIEQSALAQYASGRSMHHGVLRVQAEREAIKTEMLVLQQQRATLSAIINALRATPDAPVGNPSARMTPRRPYDVNQLFALAVAGRPELAMSRAAQKSANAEATMARRSLLPDPMLMVMAETRPGEMPDAKMGPAVPMTPMIGAGISIPLPIFAPWRQLQDVDIARARARAAVEDARAAELRIHAEIQAAVSRITTSEQREDLILSALEPRAREALDAAQAALAAGEASALEVLESRRQLQGIELELVTVRAEREAALAELDAAIGHLDERTVP
ncbi:MAG: TolC family protein [Myxococcota bacterium]